MARLLMIIPPERFRDEELFETRAVLEGAGHTITVGSTTRGECPGSRGGTATASLTLDEVDATDWDGVVFVGGGGAKLLFRHARSLELARQINEQGRLLAAICLAPVILANAGVLRGRNATVAGTEAATLQQAGATYTGPGVTVDGNVVTANGPRASALFARRICEVLDRLG